MPFNWKRLRRIPATNTSTAEKIKQIRKIRDSDLGFTRTIVSEERLHSHPDFKVIEGVEYFKNRRILKSGGMKVNGTVYTGATQREAIVTDRKYGELNKLFSRAKQKISREKTLNDGKVIKAVFDVVRESMPIRDNEAVERLLKEKQVEEDGKIALDVFIQNKTGVCRHNALAAADVLQHFAEEGYLKGKVSVERNTKKINIDGVDYNAGHAWCRYTSPSGEILIIDPMHGKIKKIKEIDSSDWDYRRASDFE